MTLFDPKWCLAPSAWVSASIKFLELQRPQPTSPLLLQEPLSHKPHPCSPALGRWGPGGCPVLSAVLPWPLCFRLFLIICVNKSVKNSLPVCIFACTWDCVLKLVLEVEWSGQGSKHFKCFHTQSRSLVPKHCTNLLLLYSDMRLLILLILLILRSLYFKTDLYRERIFSFCLGLCCLCRWWNKANTDYLHQYFKKTKVRLSTTPPETWQKW